MHERKQELKNLKNASQKVKRRKIGVWKAFAIVFLVLAILVTAGGLLLPVFETAVEALTGSALWQQVFTGSADTAIRSALDTAVQAVKLILAQPMFQNVWAAAAALWVLFVIVTLFWIRGRRKWKKSEQHLNYQTLANAIIDEQQPW